MTKMDFGETRTATRLCKVEANGSVDWYTYSGFRRYRAECHVCHGPDGMGSSYAPALANSLKTIPYAEFSGIVVSGRKDFLNGKDLVVPSFAENKNVMCYLSDIYVYLRARSVDAVPRGRPVKHAEKPAAFDANQDKCMSSG
jgi:methanol metabolism-related c-type cytochrome